MCLEFISAVMQFSAGKLLALCCLFTEYERILFAFILRVCTSNSEPPLSSLLKTKPGSYLPLTSVNFSKLAFGNASYGLYPIAQSFTYMRSILTPDFNFAACSLSTRFPDQDIIVAYSDALSHCVAIFQTTSC